MRAFAAALLMIALGGGAARAAKAIDGAVNLNTAPAEVLALLPGIGPAKAQSILAYRKRHPFRTVDELVRIKGIGRKMVRRVRTHLAVGGPTTATAATTSPAGPASPATTPAASKPPVVKPPPKLALACPHPLARPRPTPAPRVSRRSGGACWPAP